MAEVYNIAVRIQTGTERTLLATWDFQHSTVETVTGSVSEGSLVSIRSGATYYNGVSIPDWVMSQRWYVSDVYGDRAVLGRNESGTNNITSPVNVKYLKTSDGVKAVDITNMLDHYTVEWLYYTADGLWFSGDSSDTTQKYSTFDIPSNATHVYVRITPISKMHSVNGVDTSYWTPSTRGSQVYSVKTLANPKKPSTPTVKLNGYVITGSLTNLDDGLADEIEFNLYIGTKVVYSISVPVRTREASFSYTAEAGKSYRLRCRAASYCVGVRKNYSEWSDFTDYIVTPPQSPNNLKCKAVTKTSVRLDWNGRNPGGPGIKYDIEYTSDKSNFDNTDETTIKSDIEFTHFTVTGLETGKDWFFRVRASNSAGKSSWSEPSSVILGTRPAAPTTWSSTTTAITGEPLNLYWVHNSADGSSQTYAILEITIVKGEGLSDESYQSAVNSMESDGFTLQEDGTLTKVIQNSTDEDKKDKTSVYSIVTSNFTEGIQLQWRVKTRGIIDEYGEWSIQRTVYIYAKPTLQLFVKDVDENEIETLTSFPLLISTLAGPSTQIPTGYNLVITANEGYTTVDEMANKKIIVPGEIIYSKAFDIKEPLDIRLSASDLDLENGISYTVTCSVSMDSGLMAENSKKINILWEDVSYEIDAEIAIDRDSLTAYITPRCKSFGGDTDPDVLISVYRRDYTGELIEIVKNVENYRSMTVSDPHPALNYARYRIIAMDKATGAISYYDPPGYPIMESSVIIQWDEEWSNFESSNADRHNPPSWAGSLLKLPYNIDVSDNFKSDVELVNYIGRTYPVSYYGTHLDSTSTWNVEIVKDDVETLYAIRRLSSWLGNVYVREPSGSGYWATVDVSFSQKHCGLTIPVTLNITRVEGGA